MSESNPSRTRVAAIIWLLIVFAVTFDVAYLWQRAGGAYGSEFGAHPDEAAHYVTGLFVRDAVTTLPEVIAKRSVEPLKAFGPDAPGGFYAHYPKVALGVWPPGFYAVQTAWTLVFGVSRTSVLLLMASIAGAVGVLIHRVVKPEFGALPAFIAPLLWLCAPLVRAHYGMIMAEMLSTLTMFCASIFWGRYLDENRMRDAVVFGLIAAFAILVKGTGLALALTVVISVVILRKWAIFRMGATWVAAALVVIIAGPWTWYFRKAGTQVGGWADNSGGISTSFTLEAIPFYVRHLVFASGIAVAVFALVGALVRCRQGSPRAGRWTAIASLPAAVFVFQCIMPVGLEARHLIAATPSLVVLAIAGAAWIAGRPRFRAAVENEQPRRVGLWCILLLLFSLPVFAMVSARKDFAGFAPLAEWLAEQSSTSRILVCSDAVGEGMFISEVAMLDKRPGLTVERASKSLVSEKGRTWEGNNLKERFDDTELLAYLLDGKIDYIVLDSAVPDRRRASYHDQLTRVIESNPPEFWRVLESNIVRDGETMHRPLRLFRIRGARIPTSK